MPLPAAVSAAASTAAPARHIIVLPSIRSLLLRAGHQVLEATLVPLGLFYLLLSMEGLRWALVGALGWAYLAILRRLVRHEGVPGILVIGTVLLTLRTIISFVTGSVFIYFLQPTLGTYLVAGLFLLSIPLGRPLAQRLAADFCALPPALLSNVVIKRFFLRISLLWALVNIVNGTATLWLLVTSSVGKFLLLKTVGTPVIYALAIGLSLQWFRRSLRGEGVVLRWGGQAEPAAA